MLPKPDIRPIETLRWSWKAMLDNLGRRLSGTFIFAVLFCIFGWVAGGWSLGILMAALSAPAFIFFFELPGRTVETRVIPNQGIQRSFVSGLRSFAGGCLVFSILFAYLFGPPGILIGVGFGLVVALLNGWHTCIQHLILRVILWRKHYAPWNYVRWLDHTVERLLLCKVGAADPTRICNTTPNTARYVVWEPEAGDCFWRPAPRGETSRGYLPKKVTAASVSVSHPSPSPSSNLRYQRSNRLLAYTSFGLKPYLHAALGFQPD